MEVVKTNMFWYYLYIFALSPYLLMFCREQNNTVSKIAIKSPKDTSSINFDKSSIFVFKNDTLTQTLEIQSQSNCSVLFKYTCENTLRNKAIVYKGIAKAVDSWGTEMDSDERGQSYFAREYWYYGKCTLSFRIDVDDTKDKVKIHAFCKEKIKPFCPHQSVGILRKIKK